MSTDVLGTPSKPTDEPDWGRLLTDTDGFIDLNEAPEWQDAVDDRHAERMELEHDIVHQLLALQRKRDEIDSTLRHRIGWFLMALFAAAVVFAAIVLVAYGRGLLTFPAWVATARGRGLVGLS